MTNAPKKKYQENPELKAKLLELIKIVPKSDEEINKGPTRTKFIYDLKEKVIDAEKQNHWCIIFQHREGKFWVAGNNSAMIYYYHVMPVLKIKVNLKIDRDFSKKKFKNGIVTTNNIDKVTDSLITHMGCKQLPGTSEIRVFLLPEPIEKTVMETWKRSREEMRRRFNEQNIAKNLYPNIHEKAVQLQVEVANKIKRLSINSYLAYGHRGAEITEWLVFNVISAMNGRMDPQEYFEEAMMQLGYFTDWLVMVDRFELFDVQTIARVSRYKDELVDEIKLQMQIEKEKQRLKKVKQDGTRRRRLADEVARLKKEAEQEKMTKKKNE